MVSWEVGIDYYFRLLLVGKKKLYNKILKVTSLKGEKNDSPHYGEDRGILSANFVFAPEIPQIVSDAGSDYRERLFSSSYYTVLSIAVSCTLLFRIPFVSVKILRYFLPRIVEPRGGDWRQSATLLVGDMDNAKVVM